jgi:hypothetical protein
MSSSLCSWQSLFKWSKNIEKLYMIQAYKCVREWHNTTQREWRHLIFLMSLHWVSYRVVLYSVTVNWIQKLSYIAFHNLEPSRWLSRAPVTDPCTVLRRPSWRNLSSTSHPSSGNESDVVLMVITRIVCLLWMTVLNLLKYSFNEYYFRNELISKWPVLFLQSFSSNWTLVLRNERRLRVTGFFLTFPSSCILETRKHDDSETGSVSVPFYLRTETDPVSETSCYLVSRIPDDGKVHKKKQ